MAYQSSHTGSDIDTGITNIQQIFNLIYPVGSYYMSSSATNPGTLFGGTWEQITDRMIMAAGSSYTVGTTGGTTSHTHTTAEHTLTASEMPKHYHTDWHWSSPDGSQFGVNDYGATATSTKGSWKVAYSGTSSEAYFYTGYAGGGASHNHGNTGSSSNLPPYIVAYIWRRIA